MWSPWFWALFFAILIGLAAKFGFGRAGIRSVTSNYYQISWIEFAIVIAIMAVIIIPVTDHVGYSMAKANKVTYREFWGGYETQALHSSQGCTRDGSCQDTYNCDAYTVWVTHTHTSADGKSTYTTLDPETHYHDCPVATVENYWSINTTLGKYGLGMTFDDHAVPYRSSHGLDGTPQGPPALWSAAKARIDAGDPGPVTADKTYDNYILASTNTILHKFSDSVATYKKAGLLPFPVTNLNHPIYNYYYADKMQFVHMHLDPTVAAKWQFHLSQLNAALGTALQGDLHIVAIDANAVKDPDDYAGAVNAYWQDPSLGKRALSKNGIGIVLGVQNRCTITGDTEACGLKIQWVRAFTGMPVGNDTLVQNIQSRLVHLAFDSSILGHPIGVINKDGKVTVQQGNGPLEDALWGPNKFVRQHMGDFKYLKSEIQPSSGQKKAITLVAILFSMIFWALALFTVVGETKSNAY